MGVMTPAATDAHRTRYGLLSLVLLLALLVSVACAWWLVRERTGIPADRGRAIIETIAREGLAEAWGQGGLRWYAKQDAHGNVIACVGRICAPADNGYVGGRLIVRVSEDHRRLPLWKIAEKWRLSGDAASCQYECTQTYTPAGLAALRAAKQPASRSTTRIRQKDGRIRVDRSNGGQVSAEAAAPANLIPEGLSELVTHHVSRRGEEAVFSMVINSDAVRNGRMHFTTVRMTPRGTGEVELRYYAMTPEPHHVVAVCRLDDQGQIAQLAHPNEGVTQTLIAPGQLAQLFGRRAAGQYQRDLLKLIDRNGPEGERAPKPPTNSPLARPSWSAAGQGPT